MLGALPLSCSATRKAFATSKPPHAACLTSNLTLIRKPAELAGEQAAKLLLKKWQACLPCDPDNSYGP